MFYYAFPSPIIFTCTALLADPLALHRKCLIGSFSLHFPTLFLSKLLLLSIWPFMRLTIWSLNLRIFCSISCGVSRGGSATRGAAHFSFINNIWKLCDISQFPLLTVSFPLSFRCRKVYLSQYWVSHFRGVIYFLFCFNWSNKKKGTNKRQTNNGRTSHLINWISLEYHSEKIWLTCLVPLVGS